MARDSNRLWFTACDLAIGIMGSKGADADPLAYWCLVDLLMNFARQR